MKAKSKIAEMVSATKARIANAFVGDQLAEMKEANRKLNLEIERLTKEVMDLGSKQDEIEITAQQAVERAIDGFPLETRVEEYCEDAVDHYLRYGAGNDQVTDGLNSALTNIDWRAEIDITEFEAFDELVDRVNDLESGSGIAEKIEADDEIQAAIGSVVIDVINEAKFTIVARR